MPPAAQPRFTRVSVSNKTRDVKEKAKTNKIKEQANKKNKWQKNKWQTSKKNFTSPFVRCDWALKVFRSHVTHS